MAPPEKIRKSFSKFVRIICLASAITTKESGAVNDSELMIKLKKGFGALYFTAFEQEASAQANLFYSKPDRTNPFEVLIIIKCLYD